MELTNDGKPLDWNQAGDIFKQSMQDALAHLDHLNEELSAEKEKAVDAQIAAQEELRRIQREAESISAAAMDKHRAEYEARMRNDILRDVAEKLIRAAHPSEHVKRWLDIEQDIIDHIWKYLGFDMLDGKGANVSYSSEGRSGKVYFNWDGAVISLYYEFGGGNTLATIDIPTAANWEKETGFPLDKRDMILEFIAKRIIRDQAHDHAYKIHDSYIRIYS
jgi:hypothetical protein